MAAELDAWNQADENPENGPSSPKRTHPDPSQQNDFKEVFEVIHLKASIQLRISNLRTAESILYP